MTCNGYQQGVQREGAYSGVKSPGSRAYQYTVPLSIRQGAASGTCNCSYSAKRCSMRYPLRGKARTAIEAIYGAGEGGVRPAQIGRHRVWVVEIGEGGVGMA